MSLGLRNAPSTFLLFINEVLFGLEFVFPYLDDILVASENEEQHKTHLELVFDRLQKHGLRVNISKSPLGVTHLEFLGYLITPERSKPLPQKGDAILSYKLPETIRYLRTFFGLINFYRRYLKEAAKNQAILHKYLKGEVNIVADAFSRIETVTVIDYDAIADKQTHDAELKQLMRRNSSVKFKSCTSEKTLWCDISTSNIRPYIPKQFRQQIFQQIHGFSHPGIRSTIKLMTAKFIWPNMKKQIREWARACISCQKCKVCRHTKSKFGEFEVPDTRFSVIHIDLIGPLPPSQGRTFCMTCIYRFSRWMEEVPLPDCKAETASKAFYEHWVCRLGLPVKIITDQGRQFESQLFRSLAAICWAKVAHATSYHPQCNGKVEQLHRTLKEAIKAHNIIKWTDTLPTVLLGVRTALRPDTNHTEGKVRSGYLPFRMKVRVLNQSRQNDRLRVVSVLVHIAAITPLHTPMPVSRRIGERTIPYSWRSYLKPCTDVFVRVDRVKKALGPPYDDPFPVTERKEKYFTLLIKNKPVNISVDRLKPAYLLGTNSIPDKPTVPCKQSDENSAANDSNLLSDDKPTVSRHRRLVRKPVRFQD
ncbi:uncharacterized protein K02A2.6 [Trichonephila clavipes]|nr:uncharacterized protein K02A2.6 [Trichonephila clavipes]